MRTTTFITEPARCPSCARTWECATNMDGAGPPRPGDVTVCAACAEVLVYEPRLWLRRATLTDLMNLEAAQLGLLARAQAVVRRMRSLGFSPITAAQFVTALPPPAAGGSSPQSPENSGGSS